MSPPAAPVRRRPFLTARWESLVLLNYPCRREWLEPLVPHGTELDTWQGDSLVSLVGFLFTDTRLVGVPVPFHRTFEEVNLRFYVRRPGAGGVMRRAVVFIRELVPRLAVAWTARAVYRPRFADLLRTPPRSAFVAVGSAVEVHVGQRIHPQA